MIFGRPIIAVAVFWAAFSLSCCFAQTGEDQGRWYAHPPAPVDFLPWDSGLISSGSADPDSLILPEPLGSAPAGAQPLPLPAPLPLPTPLPLPAPLPLSAPLPDPLAGAPLPVSPDVVSSLPAHFVGDDWHRPPSNALLRVAIDERATVWILGRETAPQRQRRAHAGSRSFVLTGIPPGEPRPCVVSAEFTYSPQETVRLTKTVRVEPGKRYQLSFSSEEFDAARPPRRIERDLLALYTFQAAPQLNVIHDVSGVGTPLDLLIHDIDAVAWSDDGLVVESDVLIQSGLRADKILRAVQNSHELTIEAWVTPALPTTPPPGPSRIVSLSGSSGERNFTLGQQQNSYDVRLRTTQTSDNGQPSTRSLRGTVMVERTHVVFTRDSQGTTTIFLNGRPLSRSHVAGDFSGWNNRFELLLANERSGDRPWRGTFHLVAIYGRALSEQEVLQNHGIQWRPRSGGRGNP